MNSREKFNAIMDFEDNKGNLKVEYGYWAGLVKSWNDSDTDIFKSVSTGLSNTDLIRMSVPLSPDIAESNLDEKLMEYFGLESYPVKFPCDFSPRIRKQDIEITDLYRVYKDDYGLVQKVLAKGTSIPMALDFPVKTLRDFDNYKNLYDKNYYLRLPKNFKSLAESLKNRDFALRLGGHPFGFCGMARHIMGEFNFMLGLYDNPQLIKEINEFYLNFVMEYWAEILKSIEIDWVMIWEDMAFKTGPMISKDAFLEFMSLYYTRFIDFLKQYGIKNIIVDSDGLIEELIPLWVDLGITGIFPMEAVNDVIKIRQEFPGLQILGAVDKRILFTNKGKNMDQEFEKINILLKKGGFIPHIDHSIPMDADWSKFKEYRFRLNTLIEKF